ncbi:MAG: ATP-binding protein, partial [Thermoanaerobaculia bacterium]|nr:ATP-binding protein [Thermoanaerobaculia bacterium]
PSQDLITLGQTGAGDLLVTSVGGLSILDPDSPRAGIRNITLQEGLAGSVPYGLAEDRYGRIWVGTDRGLSVIDEGEIRSYDRNDGLPADDISALLTDDDGKIWVGSYGGGLVSFDPPPSLAETNPSFEVFGPDRGVPESVAALEMAPDGEIWVGTNDGVFRFNRDRGHARLSFDKDSGLIGNEVNVMKADSKGRLWTGVVGGVTIWNPNVDEPAAPPPVVRVEELRAFSGPSWRRLFTGPPLGNTEENETLWLDGSEPALSHDQNNLRVEYRALTFRERGRLRFQTKLEGFDDTWTEPTAEAFKEYTNLDPGNYEFFVRAAVRRGDWGPPERLGFEVRPAWWQTTWFATLAILGVVLILGGGYRARTYAMNARNRELEAAVDERTEDLRRYARALEEHSHALDRANERIRQSDRVKSEFLTNMSHELRTPLNAIIGFSEVLTSRLEDRLDERENLFLDNIQSSGKYLLMMINNLLDLSKIEAGRMQLNLEAVYVPAIIEEICNVVRGYATQKGIEIETRFDRTVQSVETDIGKLEQVLINLISNAVKFSPSGEVVTVAVSSAGKDHWKLSVTDRGPGIAQEDLEVIFEEFSQVRGEGSTHPGGTGLGLALVKRFVNILRGTIEVSSESGSGSTFTVTLPRKPKEVPVDQLDRRSRPRTAGILLAGTHAQLSSFTELLEREGFAPVQAHDHHEMVRYGREIQPAAAVIAIDTENPHTWRRLVNLEEELHDVEMGLIACLFNRDELRAAIGADDWIILPARPDDLAATIALQGPLSRRQSVIAVSLRSETLDMVEDALDERDFRVIRASGGTEAIEAVEDETNTCFVVDLCIEHQGGFEIVHRIQHDRRTRHLPVVILAEGDPGPEWFEKAGLSSRYDSRTSWEDLVLLTHELVRRRSSRLVRRASGLFE